MAAHNSRLSEDDLYLFNEGRHRRLYHKLGAHPLPATPGEGPATSFAVWAPNACAVSVLGDWNGWQPGIDALQRRGESGIWEGTAQGAVRGHRYVYNVVGRDYVHRIDKADPLGIYAERAPGKASIIWNLAYDWGDAAWLERRREEGPRAAQRPMSIYEVHLGSFRRVHEEGDRFLSYRELAHQLAAHVRRLGFTHVELLPVLEHPFYGSWGYQVTGYFAPTSRYGTPQDFMYLVDYLHQQGIGVILDWVPSHFPDDGHGLGYFDGTHLYEHRDPRQGVHPEWHSLLFNYGRKEVCSFLLSSACFWLDVYHIDALRVDGVASMLYLDYARKPGEWLPNRLGGRENLEAIDFLRALNRDVYHDFPDVQTIAEESTSWPLVTRPSEDGGLGFGMKWDMGWMHDTLDYLARDALFRSHHHRELTFRMMYAFSENFVLALSHDEVVHEKKPLLGKMAGDAWQKRANLRLLFGYLFAQPGKKLLFMGGEFGVEREWNHDAGLAWELLERPEHAALMRWVSDLNQLYRSERALHELDFEAAGFLWLDPDDAAHSVLSFMRRGASPQDCVVVVCNFTPEPRPDYRIGVPQIGFYQELLNSDAEIYGGSGMGNLGGVHAEAVPHREQPCSLRVLLPPLAVVFLRPGLTFQRE